MRQLRRWISWLALLVMVFYGLAPACASLLPRAAAPAVCSAEAVHACSCRPDPHGKTECCCHSPASPETDRNRMHRRTCDGGPTEAGVLWTAVNPLTLPTRIAAPTAFPQGTGKYPLVALNPRSISADLLTPPPQ